MDEESIDEMHVDYDARNVLSVHEQDVIFIHKGKKLYRCNVHSQEDHGRL